MSAGFFDKFRLQGSAAGDREPSPGKPEKKPIRLLPAAVLLLLFVLFIASVLLMFRKADDEPEGGPEKPGMLSLLPMPDEDAPFVMIEAVGTEFPLIPAGLLADSVTIYPGGGSPIGALLPLFENAGMSALVITEREKGLSMYGAMLLDEPRRSAGSGGVSPALPDGWEECFLMPEIVSTDLPGVMELRAMNTVSPLYFSAEDGRLYVTDSLYDMVRINSVRDGSLPGISRACTSDCDMQGHAHISDGGITAGVLFDSEGRPDEFGRDPARTLALRACWRTLSPEGRRLSDNLPSGEVVWSISGLEGLTGRTYVSSLVPYDWSQDSLFIPEPLIMSAGINMPVPGRRLRELPPPFRFVISHLERMKLRQSDIAALLTGPAAVSLGGRTQVLWYELPGIVADLPRRGDAGDRLIERFWSELFSGIKPKPVEGYPTGGATDFPFALTAVGNEDRALVGLTSPGVEQNSHLKELISGEESAIGWFYLDLPRLSSSITDVPHMSELLSEEEGSLMEDEVFGPVHKAMRNMGAVFVVWRSAHEGRATWYK